MLKKIASLKQILFILILYSSNIKFDQTSKNLEKMYQGFHKIINQNNSFQHLW